MANVSIAGTYNTAIDRQIERQTQNQALSANRLVGLVVKAGGPGFESR